MSLLQTHRVNHSLYKELTGPHLFDLNSDYDNGINITDQMRRGHGIILEALREKIIGPDKPLLVIGAGVAGMMAAVTAALKRVPTRVIEQKDGMISVQANCPSRWVCPTQYGWPEKGWDEGAYPRDKREMPFAWLRGVADVQADSVRQTLQKIINANEWVEVVTSIEFTGYDLVKDQSGQWRVIPRLNTTPKDPYFPRTFSMALACAGFGEENTMVERTECIAPEEKYTGHIFWQLDHFEKDDPPLGIDSGAPNVLISGSGDGALQDFLRVATKIDAEEVVGRPTVPRASSAAALYSRVFEQLPGTERRISRRIRKIEQRHHQELRRKYSDEVIRTLHQCVVNGEAQLQHLLVIKELCRERRVWSRVVDSLDRFVKDLRDEIRIAVVYPCFHISPNYGLNRFLTLLLVAYAYQRYPDVQLLYPGRKLTQVVGAGAHAPPAETCKRPEDCHGKDHRAFWTPADCLAVRLSRDAGAAKEESEFEGGPYNAVIIRHGILRRCRKVVLSEIYCGTRYSP